MVPWLILETSFDDSGLGGIWEVLKTKSDRKYVIVATNIVWERLNVKSVRKLHGPFYYLANGFDPGWGGEILEDTYRAPAVIRVDHGLIERLFENENRFHIMLFGHGSPPGISGITFNTAGLEGFQFAFLMSMMKEYESKIVILSILSCFAGAEMFRKMITKTYSFPITLPTFETRPVYGDKYLLRVLDADLEKDGLDQTVWKIYDEPINILQSVRHENFPVYRNAYSKDIVLCQTALRSSNAFLVSDEQDCPDVIFIPPTKKIVILGRQQIKRLVLHDEIQMILSLGVHVLHTIDILESGFDIFRIADLFLTKSEQAVTQKYWIKNFNNESYFFVTLYEENSSVSRVFIAQGVYPNLVFLSKNKRTLHWEKMDPQPKLEKIEDRFGPLTENSVYSIFENGYLHLDELVELRVAQDQESFIASNEVALTQVALHPEDNSSIYAIMNGPVVVGLLILSELDDMHTFEGIYIRNFMIDRKYQGKGFGKRAMQNLLKNPLYNVFVLSYVPSNQRAADFYRSFGFKIVKERDAYGNVMMAYFKPGFMRFQFEESDFLKKE